MIRKQDEAAIYDEVSKCIGKLKDPFNKGIPVLRSNLWKIGEKYGITGGEVLKIYFDNLPEE